MDETIPVPSFHYVLHPYSTALVTCCDTEGKPNIITIAWLIPVSVKPPLVGMSISPARYSYKLIQTTGEFVINIAPYEIAHQVLFCGRRSGRDVDKFSETGLSPGQALHVRPPIIKECHAHLECRMVQDVEAGDHHLVVAEVLAAYAKPGVIDENGLYRLSYARPLLHLGRSYFTSALDYSEEQSLSR